jgi:pterin-4a-carbinolamine dehydratase
MILLNNYKAAEDILRKDRLKTFHIRGRLKSNSPSLYVDHIDHPKVLMLKDEEWYAPFSENVYDMIKSLNEHEFHENIDFCGLSLDIAEIIMKELKGYEVVWQEHCVLYYLPEDAYQSYLYLEGDSLESLEEEDLETVNEYYTYKSEDSFEYLKDCITKFPSSKIKDESGRLISWALMREDGSLGVMYTKKDYRNKGYALKISKDLISKAVKINHQPYVHIVVDNYPSRKLAEVLGMIYYEDVMWFGVKKCDD